jgi:hypothetical protein
LESPSSWHVSAGWGYCLHGEAMLVSRRKEANQTTGSEQSNQLNTSTIETHQPRIDRLYAPSATTLFNSFF